MKLFFQLIIGILATAGNVWAQQVLDIDELRALSNELKAELSNANVTFIETETISPLNINFLPSLYQNQLEGKVFTTEDTYIDRIDLEIVSPNGERLYQSQKQIDSKDFLAEGFTFRIQVPEQGIADFSLLTAESYIGDRLVAVGSQPIPEVERAPQYAINEFKVREVAKPSGDSLWRGEYGFENKTTFKLAITPLAKISRVEGGNPVLVERIELDQVDIDSRSLTELDFDMSVPTEPGLYQVELIVLDADRKPITGTAISEKLVTGLFGEISAVDFQYSEAQEQAFVRLKGSISAEGLMPRLEVSALRLGSEGGGSSLLLTPVSDFEVFNGAWEQVFSIDSLGLGGAVAIDTQVFVGDKLVNTQKDEFLLPSKPVVEVVEDTKIVQIEKPINIIDPSIEDTIEPVKGLMHWWFWGGFIIVIILLIFMRWLRGRKKKFLSLIFLLSALLGPSIGEASLKVFWYHPVTNWGYNPKASGRFDNFETIRFQGRIYNVLSQRGFFAEAPQRLVVRFFSVLDDDNDFYLEITDYTTSDNREYVLEFDVPDLFEDGDWSAQLYFLMSDGWYATDWRYSQYNQISGEWEFLQEDPAVRSVQVDTTAPEGTFFYDTINENIALPVFSRVRPIETDPGTGLLNRLDLRRAKTNDKKRFEHQIKLKEEQRGDLIRFRNDRVNRLRDLVNIKNQLIDAGTTSGQQISQINAQISTLIGNGVPGQPGYTPGLIQNLSSEINTLTDEIGRNIDITVDTGPDIVGISSLQNPRAVPVSSPDSLNSKIVALTNTLFTLDSQIQGQRTQLKTIKNQYKDQFVNVRIACSDDTVGCHRSDLVFDVKGNFCADDQACDDTAVRSFGICDSIGNCTSENQVELDLDWYDPVDPTAVSVALEVKDEDQVEQLSRTSGSIAANEGFYLELDVDDPISNRSTHPLFYDINACGFDADSDFFLENNGDLQCLPTVLPCAVSATQRGEQDIANSGTCVATCAPGFLPQGNLCVPGCDFRLFDGCFPFRLIGDSCITTDWTPLPETQPLGQTFVQTSNCGATRSAIGTGSTGSVARYLDGANVLAVKIHNVNQNDWKFWAENTAASWYSEPKDDSDGTCDYLVGDGDGDPSLGQDDRCGSSKFPDVAILVLTAENFYIFDLYAQSLWMKFDAQNGKGIPSGISEGVIETHDGKIFIGYKRSGGLGGLTTLDFVTDEIRFWDSNNSLAYVGDKSGGIENRNIIQTSWSQDTTSGEQLLYPRVNDLSATRVGGTLYLAAGLERGMTLFKLSDRTNLNFNYVNSGANSYNNVYITRFGKLWYQWDYSADNFNRIWLLDGFDTLNFDGGLLTGNATSTSQLRPVNVTGTYPVSSLAEGASTFGISADESTIYAGGAEGVEIFTGNFTAGANHAAVARQKIDNLYTTLPMLGDISGHWAYDLIDTSGQGNDVTSAGAVTVEPALTGSEVLSYNFNGGSRFLDFGIGFGGSSEVSAGAWIYSEAPANDDGGYILSKKDATQTDFALYRTSTNGLRSDGPAGETLIPDVTLSGWNFVVVTFDGISKRTYVDGRLVDTSSESASIFDQVARFTLGNRTSGNNSTDSLNAKIAFPFVSESLYSSEKIQRIYEQSSSWFSANAKVTLQNLNSNVDALASKLDGSYFVATSGGITHFDQNGLVIRTLSTAPTTSDNIQIASNAVVDLRVSGDYLIVGYDGSGVEIIYIP